MHGEVKKENEGKEEGKEEAEMDARMTTFAPSQPAS
jgi:hypothetical protein